MLIPNAILAEAPLPQKARLRSGRGGASYRARQAVQPSRRGSLVDSKDGNSSTVGPSVDTSNPLRRHLTWMASA